MEQDIVGKRIKGIQARLELIEGATYCQSILVSFQDGGHLLLAVNTDTDEIMINEPAGADFTGEKTGALLYEEFTGKQIVSYWAANNHLGYCDLFALAIDEFKPTLLIGSLGSSLCISLCNYLPMA